ncbi:hypothetical protein KR505_19420 [Eubacterium callanderi]|uniref:hypothetical protein n=1 Tax=Eubacterium callanderi TaxID=53442 RepID=UPI001C2CE855|nr:hypothetical protein [Eubacterium callanderi]MBV1685571.1 hypothetical protein [Eubacterium callanderi]
MELNLNKNYVRQCNDNSMTGTKGDRLAEEAIKVYREFNRHFPERNSYTNEQKQVLCERREGYQALVEDYYNGLLCREAQMVSVVVAGPSNYNSGKYHKQMERLVSFSRSGEEKMKRFIDNTYKRINDLEPLEMTLEKIKSGELRYGESISSDDPHAIEKLEAKAYHLRELQDKMKAQNKYARKLKRKIPHSPFMLSNNLQSLKSIEDRIKCLKKQKSTEFKEMEFDHCKVIPDKEDNRVRILFDGKPDEIVRTRLKQNGFHWSPKNGAWQRQLTEAAMRTAILIAESL